MNIENRIHPERRIRLTGWAAACAAIGIVGALTLTGWLWSPRAERAPEQRIRRVAATSESRSVASDIAKDAVPRLHDEVQYFADKCSEGQQRVGQQRFASHVQAS